MNCFTHALPFLDQPYFAVGSCLPDWLSACDRKCRVREKSAAGFTESDDEVTRQLAAGIVQHHQDDGWFHTGPKFNELTLKFGMELRERFSNERSMRPSFIGHILVEMLLDSHLNSTFPGKLEKFYKQISKVDPRIVEQTINQFATKTTDRLAIQIGRFIKERFIFDYSTDEGIVYRINRVLAYVKLPQVPKAIFDWLPSARKRVCESAQGLLHKYSIGF